MQKMRIGCFAVLACVGIAAYVLISFFALPTQLFGIFLFPLSLMFLLAYTMTSVPEAKDFSIQPLPAPLQKSHESLLALGFEPIGSVGVQEFFIRYRVWAYLSQDKYTHAYLGGLTGRTWFSSYFAHGIDITTNFQQGGIPISNEKIKESIVTSSLEATLDFHLHQVQNHANQWGNPLIFVTMQEQVEWEKQNKTYEAINFSFMKGFLVGIARYVLGSIITMPVYWLYIYPNETISLDTRWFWFLVAFVSPLIFALMPLFYSRTVESRKKKKIDEKEKLDVV